MKTLIIMTAFFLAGPIQAEENPYSANLFYYKGKVSLSSDGGEFGGVEKGDNITEGDIIKTGARSFAIVRFPDKSTMRVDANSEIKIERIVERIGETSLGSSDIILKAGRAVIDVINKSKAPVFNVRTKGVAMGVRGTRFLVGIDSFTGNTELAVDRGEVEISQIGNPNLSDAVVAGHAINLEKGREFTQPQKYDWVKKFNFNANDKDLNHRTNDLVHEAKREEFRLKKKAWKRYPARWKAQKDKWKRLRAQYLKRADRLKEKRKEFRERKKSFQEKQKEISAKRNNLIKENKSLKKEAVALKKVRATLEKESLALRTGRKDPRRTINLARRKNNLENRSAKLKERAISLKERRSKLIREKKALSRDFMAKKKRLKKMQKVRKRMMKSKKLKKRQQQHQSTGADGTTGP